MDDPLAIYKPAGSTTLAEQTYEQRIRLGLQAPPFGGKTVSALSFPIPTVLNYDQKLGYFAGRSDVIQVPFWDGIFVDKIKKRDGILCKPNRKEALQIWLAGEALKLTKDQTLVLDNSTEIEKAYHSYMDENPVYTKTGEVNTIAEWGQKIDYFDEICTYLKSLRCHVVYICHETVERDKKGELTGGIKPLLSGQSGDKIGGSFTDWFRVLSFSKPINDEQIKKCKDHFKLDETTYKEWMASGTKDTFWVWQTQDDETCRYVGTSSLVDAPKYVLANYSSFSKYRRSNKTTV